MPVAQPATQYCGPQFLKSFGPLTPEPSHLMPDHRQTRPTRVAGQHTLYEHLPGTEVLPAQQPAHLARKLAP